MLVLLSIKSYKLFLNTIIRCTNNWRILIIVINSTRQLQDIFFRQLLKITKLLKFSSIYTDNYNIYFIDN